MLAGIVAFSVLASAHQTDQIQLFEGLGPFHRGVSTSNPLAAKYLDQGFDFLYGFDYGLARRSFKEAVRLDPNLVLGYWGIATANGNNINSLGVSAFASKEAIEALSKAKLLNAVGSPVENALVDAAMRRFSLDAPEHRAGLDKAYANAMRKVWQQYPKDPDVGALFAESLLNLSPWNQWTWDGNPQPDTPEILSTLRAVLAIAPMHPQALHLWVHAVEGSKEPQQGLDEADKLMDLQPGIVHMQHMPSHVYARAGEWQKAIYANTKSIAVYHRLSWKEGSSVDYGHARHMLAYSAAMRGQSELALHNVTQILDGLDLDTLQRQAGNVDFFGAMKPMFLVRFGRWKELLAMPEPPAFMPYTRAMYFESRGIAFAAQKDSTNAIAEQSKFEIAKKALLEGQELKAVRQQALDIASHVLWGEILTSQGKADDGLAELSKAVDIEEHMTYTEPPTWIMPTRDTLGAALVEARKYEQAIVVYKDDLKEHPNNGWALYGLYRSYTGLGQIKEASQTLIAFKKAWADADLEITSSCMCLPGKR